MKSRVKRNPPQEVKNILQSPINNLRRGWKNPDFWYNVVIEIDGLPTREGKMKERLVSRVVNREARLWGIWDRRLTEFEAAERLGVGVSLARKNLTEIKRKFGLAYDANGLLAQVRIRPARRK